MAHEIETMAWTGKPPWHKLGVYIADEPSIEEMICKAGLDWTVVKHPLMAASRYDITEHVWSKFNIQVPGQFALVRNSDHSVLDIVGSRYIPVQPRKMMEFFRDFVEQGSATLETAGSLRGGRYIWCLANLKQSFTLPGKDKVKAYLLIACPYEQGKAFIIMVTHIRVVCQNTLSLALAAGGLQFRMSHRMEFDEEMMEKAKEVIGLAREDAGQFEKVARKLKKLKLVEKDAIRVIAPIMIKGIKDEVIEEMVKDFDNESTPKMRQIMDAYHNAPGADPGTGWGALNAVTFWSDHITSRTRDKRLTNAWFGRTARQKEKLLTALLEKAA